MKRIAVFSDGTWNAPDRQETTNVLRLARAVKPRADGSGAEQVAYYDWGVGSDRLIISGGISGHGIDKNIMDCYRFIVHNYNDGDKLYFFGFSRGAYTVRSLAGFIRNCGLLKREHAERIPEAFRLYRKRNRASGPNGAMPKAFRQRYAVADISPIEFVGVWDTVGSLGIPVPFWGTLGESEFLFHDTEPSKIVQHARHAVSIDENREDFQPTLWDQKAGLDLQQVWFAGVHSDVGGGYAADGLSHCSLHWMVAEADRFGLEFEPYLLNWINPRHDDRLHNERRGIFRARKAVVRDISGPVHRFVKDRWDENARDYQRKSQALRQLLASVGNDWSKVEVVGH